MTSQNLCIEFFLKMAIPIGYRNVLKLLSTELQAKDNATVLSRHSVQVKSFLNSVQDLVDNHSSLQMIFQAFQNVMQFLVKLFILLLHCTDTFLSPNLFTFLNINLYFFCAGQESG